MIDPTRDEAILALLRAGPAGSLAIADRLAIPDRAVRRRLRRLIEDGYVFSPARGQYRITVAGLGAIAPLSDDPAGTHPAPSPQSAGAPGERPRKALYERFLRR